MGATYPLERWREAIDHAMSAGRLGTFKVAFAPQESLTERDETTMPRPGFVLEVDERTPPLLVHEGEGFRMQKFPLGTRVVYPPDSLPGIQDVERRDPARAAAPGGRLEAAARAAARRA